MGASQSLVHRFSKSRDWTEIAVGFLAIEVCLWTVRPVQLWCMLVALILVLTMVFLDGRSAGHLGLSTFRFLHSAGLVLAAGLLCGMELLMAKMAGTLRPLYGTASLPGHVVAYIFWAIVQQFILQSFFFVRFENVLGSTRQAVVAAAVLFGFVHLPNPVLVPVTFLGALVLCELFRRWRSIFALGIAHAMVGLTVAVSMPDPVLRHMRVGLGYLRYGG